MSKNKKNYEEPTLELVNNELLVKFYKGDKLTPEETITLGKEVFYNLLRLNYPTGEDLPKEVIKDNLRMRYAIDCFLEAKYKDKLTNEIYSKCSKALAVQELKFLKKEFKDAKEKLTNCNDDYSRSVFLARKELILRYIEYKHLNELDTGVIVK